MKRVSILLESLLQLSCCWEAGKMPEQLEKGGEVQLSRALEYSTDPHFSNRQRDDLGVEGGRVMVSRRIP